MQTLPLKAAVPPNTFTKTITVRWPAWLCSNARPLLRSNGLHWRSAGNSLLVWPALMTNGNAMLKLTLKPNRRRSSPEPNLQFCWCEVCWSSPNFGYALLYAGFDIAPRFEKLVIQQILFSMRKAKLTFWNICEKIRSFNNRIGLKSLVISFTANLQRKKL